MPTRKPTTKKTPTKKRPAAKPTPKKKPAAKQQEQSRRKMRNNQKTKAAAIKQGKTKPATTTRKKKIGKVVVPPAVVSGLDGAGRPTELTQERADRICEAISRGHFIIAVMQGEGLARSTYYEWIERGSRDRQDGVDSLYAEFSDMIKKAEFEAEDLQLMSLATGELGWTAHAWILERRFPSRWGNRLRLSMEDGKDFMRKFMNTVAQHIPDRELLRKIVADVRKIEGEAREFAAGK